MIYVAFLRGIMPMNPQMRNEKIIALLEGLGLKNVKAVIASGNFIFESDLKATALEKMIEESLPLKLGFSSTTIIRSRSELDKLIAADPFSRATGKPNVTFFKKKPSVAKLPKSGKGFTGHGLIGGAFCFTVDMKVVKTPEGMITMEKAFGKQITTRTWNTVLRIREKMG